MLFGDAKSFVGVDRARALRRRGRLIGVVVP